MLEKLTLFKDIEIAAAATFMFAAILLKTILHSASRTFNNFMVSLLSGYTLGFLAFFLVGETWGGHPWMAITVSIFIAMISDRIFAAYLAANTAGFFKWICSFVADKLDKATDAFIERIIKK